MKKHLSGLFCATSTLALSPWAFARQNAKPLGKYAPFGLQVIAYCRRTRAVFATALMAAAACAPALLYSAADDSSSEQRLFLIGQDLGAIRAYVRSDCCAQADGGTAYVSFYDLLSADAAYGGLGIDPDGRPVDIEADWGAGPGSAYKTATEFGFEYLALGLFMTENHHPGGLDQIAAGERDREIAQLARFAHAVDTSILLRIGYEFDGAWNQGYADAARYVRAYRRIVDGLRERGVGNVIYVWQGAASSIDAVIDGGRRDVIRDWYPGDAYVDWLGFSWFMHPDERPSVELPFAVPPPRELADEILELAREVGKPVLVAEAAPQGYDLREKTFAHRAPLWDGKAGSGTRAVASEAVWTDWFQPMFDYVEANGDVIRGLAYINVRWDDQDMWDAPYESGYWGDTRLEVDRTIAVRFSAAIDRWRSARD